ncbi:class I SAM-dependent methyltransferase [Cytobacillus pseudoceanisediminis]|uniref:class I SAM-dependent methyltransferase n=1 Tax=Cytobacillus pseudoceanisediminis TaxID=3051614 RepID=UPI003C30ABFF
MSVNEKWKKFFGEDYLKFSEVILSPERTEYEVSQLLKILELPEGSKILDLGCGQGRISIPLAKAGYQVTALDGSEPLLTVAKQRAEEAGVFINFVCSDMQKMNFENEFDAVLNLGTAFGYVAEERDDQLVLELVNKALVNEGTFIQDCENRENKLKAANKIWEEMNGNIVWSKREFNSVTGRWREELFWTEEHETKSRLLDIRLYAATELIKMTTNAGLTVQNVYGGLDLSELTMNSLRTVIVSKKVINGG